MAKRQLRKRRTGDSSDLVYSGLRRLIIEQSLAVGARLPEDAVAARFGVGRTVVREAIARLAGEGLVERRSNHGARVAVPAAEEADDIATVRKEIEAIVVTRLASRLSAEDVERLHAHVRLQQESFADRPTAVRISAEFHVLLAEMTGSPTLYRYVSDLVARSSLVFLAQTTAYALGCGPKEHGEIIDALAKGDPQAAEAKMRKHLTDVDDRSRHLPGPAKEFSDLPPTIFRDLKK